MATTVTYKGATLTTVDNQTKTLETAGTWMEDDLTLTDVSGGGSGEWTTDGLATRAEPNGAIVVTANNIVPYGFTGSAAVTSFVADSVTLLRQSILADCSNIESISFASATTANGTQQFVNCSKLTSVNLPNLTALNNQMFQGCTSLEFIDFPKLTGLNRSGVFRNCYKLQTVVLRHTSVVPANNDTFANTPFAGYNGLSGTVYVPSALISSYQTATNWSTLYNAGTCNFVAIEGSIYE